MVVVIVRVAGEGVLQKNLSFQPVQHFVAAMQFPQFAGDGGNERLGPGQLRIGVPAKIIQPGVSSTHRLELPVSVLCVTAGACDGDGVVAHGRVLDGQQAKSC